MDLNKRVTELEKRAPAKNAPAEQTLVPLPWATHRARMDACLAEMRRCLGLPPDTRLKFTQEDLEAIRPATRPRHSEGREIEERRAAVALRELKAVRLREPLDDEMARMLYENGCSHISFGTPLMPLPSDDAITTER